MPSVITPAMTGERMNLGQREPVAKRPHRCDWCDRVIARGTLYRRWGSRLDGSVQTVTAHIGCDDVGTAWYREAGVPEDEAAVDVRALTEWALARMAEGEGALADALGRMAEEQKWPDGDRDRLVKLLVRA